MPQPSVVVLSVTSATWGWHESMLDSSNWLVSSCGLHCAPPLHSLISPVDDAQITFHPLAGQSVKDINAIQMKGGAPTPDLIHDPTVTRLVKDFNLLDEMFPTDKQQ